MKIDEEINQKKFHSEFQKAALNVIVTANWVSSHIHNTLKPFGISQEQYNVLRILRGQYPKPCTLGTITERMVNKMSNATRLVDKLKKAGYVSREICPDNRRKVDIMVSDLGLKLLSEIDPVLLKKLDDIQFVEDGKLAQLNDILDDMRE